MTRSPAAREPPKVRGGDESDDHAEDDECALRRRVAAHHRVGARPDQHGGEQDDEDAVQDVGGLEPRGPVRRHELHDDASEHDHEADARRCADHPDALHDVLAPAVREPNEGRHGKRGAQKGHQKAREECGFHAVAPLTSCSWRGPDPSGRCLRSRSRASPNPGCRRAKSFGIRE